MMSRTHDEVDVQVQLQAGMEPELHRYAQEKITTVLGHTGRPVLYARVRLDRIANPAASRPVTARAEIDLLQDRLEARLEHERHGHR